MLGRDLPTTGAAVLFLLHIYESENDPFLKFKIRYKRVGEIVREVFAAVWERIRFEASYGLWHRKVCGIDYGLWLQVWFGCYFVHGFTAI